MAGHKFVVIEGGDGSGKSTMVKVARELFPDAVVTREPGGAPFAEKIRSIILSPDAKDADANTQFGLFWAARADHLKNTIIPALAAGKHVISDRFDASSYAYQIFGQRNKHLKELFWKIRQVYLGSYFPSVYIFLDVDPAVGLRRRAADKGSEINHFDERDLAFHERIKEGYLEFFQHTPSAVIDANQSLNNVRTDFRGTLHKYLA